VVVGRKVVLLLIAVAFRGAGDIPVQSPLLALTLCVAMLAHTFVQPFEDDYLNKVEFVSLFTTICLFVAGQLLHADGLSDGVRGFVSVLIIALVTVFVVCFLADTVRRFWIHRQTAKGSNGNSDENDDAKVCEREGGREGETVGG
jgi:hypothetical protein